MFNIIPLGNPFDAINKARNLAPHLERLCKKFPQIIERLQSEDPEIIINEGLEQAKNARNLDLNAAMKSLRQAKGIVHLVLSACDLSQSLKAMQVTKYLSDLADICLESALELAIKDAAPRDRPAFINGKVPGLFIIAMGKHGAGELNYSSDIDLAAFFDREAFHEDYHYQATAICVRIIGALSRILEDITIDNYVFRVDWRLRPDPSSTPLAVSVQSAEIYYEAVGQNWERAALIKARPICGDMEIARNFLKDLQPFIWRKYLDFAAVLDVGSILQQIHRVNRSADLENPAFDVKLGRGGIREIEFFTQTQQLILGGKDSNLRNIRTLDALKSLRDAGRIMPQVCAELSNCYEFLRNIEHRVQMVNDEQTHALPENIEKRTIIAKLSGFEDLAQFDAIVKACRFMVRENIQGLFPDAAPLANISGSLVFTGVDDDEETIETLAQMGFKNPQRVSSTIRGWHHGRIRATRTPRAREILTSITPELLNAISQTQEADLVFSRFDDFISGLSAGVQTLALFQTEPQILRETCLTLALSNRLATDLSKKPAILDAMLSPRFHEPLHHENFEDSLKLAQNALKNCQDFETALDLIRRYHREEAFKIGYHILHGRAQSDAAGVAYSNLARICIETMLPWAIKEVAKSHGNFDGEIAICGWGKLGGYELAADSDLDLMVIYRPKAENSDGERSISAETYYAKVTQKLIMALSVQTAEGPLYEVDMQLRPSGKKGPVAVRFSSFENYYKNEAWTWEFQALTRLTPLVGDKALCDDIKMVALEDIKNLEDNDKILKDIFDMRDKIRDNIKPRGTWDLKRLDGGIIDLEFIAQAYQLLNAKNHENIINANTLLVIENLANAKIIEGEEAMRLISAGRALNKIRQILAIVAGADFNPENASNATKMVIAQSLQQPEFGMAQAVLNDARAIIAKHSEKLFTNIIS